MKKNKKKSLKEEDANGKENDQGNNNSKELKENCVKQFEPVTVTKEESFENSADEDVQLVPPPTPVELLPPTRLLTPAGQRFEVCWLDNVNSTATEDEFGQAQQQPTHQETYNPPQQPVNSDTLQEIVGRLQLLSVADALAVYAADKKFDSVDVTPSSSLTEPRTRHPLPERSLSGLTVWTALPKEEMPEHSEDKKSRSMTNQLGVGPLLKDAKHPNTVDSQVDDTLSKDMIEKGTIFDFNDDQQSPSKSMKKDDEDLKESDSSETKSTEN